MDVKVVKAVQDAIDQRIKSANSNRASSHMAEVVEVDKQGTVWVHIFGGAEKTPATKALVHVEKGDLVTATIEDGSVTVMGSPSSPAASEKQVVRVAEDTAEAMQNADEARDAAQSAQASASVAAQAADEAQVSATVANKAANSALNQLGVVQDVVGVLNYVAEHGGFVQTQDQSIVEGKVYFTLDSQTGDYVPVVDPQASALSSYYEVSEDYDDVMGDFIMAHLAVTSRGLWVLPSGMGSSTTPASGESQADSDARQGANYKMLLSSDGTYIYDGSGDMVIKYGQNIEPSTDRPFYIGDPDSTSYILFTPASGSTPANISIGGSVKIGTSKTLSELLAEVDAKAARGTGILKVTTAPSSYTTQTGGFTPMYRIALSTVKSQAGVDDVVVGDVIEYSYYHYPVGYVDSNYVYTGARTSIRGAQGERGIQGETGASGTSVTVSRVEYATSTTESQPSSGWSTTAPSTVAEGSWLWVKTTYSDGTEAVTRSKQGTSGSNGTSVTVSKVEYGTSNSASTSPSSWSQTVPTSIANGKWLWVKTTYSDNSTATTKSYVGTDGQDGKSVYVSSSTKVDGVTTVVLSDGTSTTTIQIADGDDGDNGQPGAAGDDSYVHFAWANSADGTTDFSTSVSAGKLYMGVYSDNTLADSQVASDYSWTLVKGEQGQQGPQGDTGPEAVVEVYPTVINWTSGTATLAVRLYVNGSVVQASSISSYAWSKDGVAISGQTSSTLAVSDLDACYSCTVTW